jgi:DNA-binding CsgD family transcriptional regulator
MTERVPVFVYARDPLSQAGIAAELRGRPELEVLSQTEVDQADVAVVAADEVDNLSQVGRVQRHVLAPRGLTFSGLTERELGVLRLVADGLDTGEIAQQLAYSERTIKNIIHDITTRFHLRNRSHAVAFALRQGLI